jgi:hypothetical protein
MCSSTDSCKIGYAAFGLNLCSNLPIPGLSPIDASVSCDVAIRLNELPEAVLEWDCGEATPFYETDARDEQGRPELKVFRVPTGRYLLLVCWDGTKVAVSVAGDEVWATWNSNSSLEDTATYLLGPVFGLVLRQRHGVCLHAGAFAIRNAAFALVGPSGAGKSTTTAALAIAGVGILADDVCALTGEGSNLVVQPAYPRIRLYPESVEGLFGVGVELPRLTPNWHKCYLDLCDPGYRFEARPLPLAGVFVLSARQRLATVVQIENLSAREALMELLAETYANRLLTRDQRSREFNALSELVRQVPAWRVSMPDSLATLPKAIEQLLDTALRSL